MTIKERVYNAIWNDIANGNVRPDHVFNEKDLVEKYNVSKSPVRDALIELCSNGILRSIPRYGYEIVRISGKDLSEIIQMRALIELDNLDKIFYNISDEQLDKLKQYSLQAEKLDRVSNPSPWDKWESNMGFHKLLYSFGNNSFGSLLLDRCMMAQTVAYSMSYIYDDTQRELLDANRHIGIISMIECGDKEAALEAMQKDLGALKGSVYM